MRRHLYSEHPFPATTRAVASLRIPFRAAAAVAAAAAAPRSSSSSSLSVRVRDPRRNAFPCPPFVDTRATGSQTACQAMHEEAAKDSSHPLSLQAAKLQRLFS